MFAAAGDNGRDLQHELGRALQGEQGGVQAAVDALLRLDDGELTLLLRKAVRDLKLIELLIALEAAAQFLDREIEHRHVNTILEELDVEETAAAIETQLESLAEFEFRIPVGKFASVYGKMKEFRKLSEDDKLAQDVGLLLAGLEKHVEEWEKVPSFINRQLLAVKLSQLLVLARRDHPKLWGMITGLKGMRSGY